MTPPIPGRYTEAVDASALIPDDNPIDYRSKAFGPAQQGRTVAELVAAGTVIDSLPTPLLTLDAGAVDNNVAAMRRYLRRHRLSLAPHGKTTMAPALWRQQLTDGAWALTVATPWQLRVAVSAGARRILHAGAVVDPAELAGFAELLAGHPDLQILVWADSAATVELLATGFPAGGPRLSVLVDRGGPGARTGTRSTAEAVAVAVAICAAPQLRLAGVAAWEGSLTGVHGPDGRRLLTEFCQGALDAFTAIEQAGLFDGDDLPVLSAGGSAYFDVVTEVFGQVADRARIVLRSGCYLTHDDGLYADTSPLAGELRSALHGWAQVVSRPEPGLALLNAGRRDLPFDTKLPVPQLVRGRSASSSAAALAGAGVRGLNDQHLYLELDPASDLAVGEVVRFGISHPCTAFDKWTVIPVVADAQVDRPVLIGAIRTVF